MTPGGQKECPYCKGLFKPAGLTNHKRACKKKFDTAAQDKEFMASLLAEPQTSLPVPRFVAPWERNARVGRSPTNNTPGAPVSTDSGGSDHPGPTGDSSRSARSHQDGDIQVEHCQNGGRGTDHLKTKEDRQSVPDAGTEADPEPWKPFRTREDFEFAEIVLDAGMTSDQIDAMIQLIHKCVKNGKGSFTISNHNDIEVMLQHASNRLTKAR